MTVRELMEILEACDPEAEVRLATQSSYPFQNSVAGVIDGNLIVEYAMEDLEPSEALDVINDFDGLVAVDTVYILEGSQLGYFTRRAWDAIG